MLANRLGREKPRGPPFQVGQRPLSATGSREARVPNPRRIRWTCPCVSPTESESKTPRECRRQAHRLLHPVCDRAEVLRPLPSHPRPGNTAGLHNETRFLTSPTLNPKDSAAAGHSKRKRLERGTSGWRHRGPPTLTHTHITQATPERDED